jgi:hypothetical protein
VIPFRKPLQEVYVRNTLAILDEIELLDRDVLEGDTEDDE